VRRRQAQQRAAVDGILLLDKPAGLTSNAALQQAKRLLNARKAGHTGSLDPLATGLLPVCFGEATKISQYLIDSDKSYRASIVLGVTTDTCDADGQVIDRHAVAVTAVELEQALQLFHGDIEQVPPMYSALKRDGQPLYKLARQGVEVERKARQVAVRQLQLLSFDGQRLEIEITCSKGFYVRSLAHDLGVVLGCGGHITELRRTAVGEFSVSDAVTLAAVDSLPVEARPGLLLPLDSGLQALPKMTLTMVQSGRFRQGQDIGNAAGETAAGIVRVYDEHGQLLGLGQLRADRFLAPRRLFRAEGGDAPF
jgi:tRNA pseudouridine55 synthase